MRTSEGRNPSCQQIYFATITSHLSVSPTSFIKDPSIIPTFANMRFAVLGAMFLASLAIALPNPSKLEAKGIEDRQVPVSLREEFSYAYTSCVLTADPDEVCKSILRSSLAN